MLPGQGLRWEEGVASYSTMTPEGMLSNAFWSTALVSASFLFRLSFILLPLWALLSGLQHLNLVSHPERAVFAYSRADSTTTL